MCLRHESKEMFVLRFPRSVFVRFGERQIKRPSVPSIPVKGGWLPVRSVRNLLGDELRDRLTVDHLRELQLQLVDGRA